MTQTSKMLSCTITDFLAHIALEYLQQYEDEIHPTLTFEEDRTNKIHFTLKSKRNNIVVYKNLDQKITQKKFLTININFYPNQSYLYLLTNEENQALYLGRSNNPIKSLSKHLGLIDSWGEISPYGYYKN